MLFNLINHNNDSKYINFVDFKVFVCDPFNIDIVIVIWKFNRSKKRLGVSVTVTTTLLPTIIIATTLVLVLQYYVVIS